MIRASTEPRTDDASTAMGGGSGALARPIHCIRRQGVTARSARTELERYKVSLRRYAPVGGHLPWPCQANCTRCDQVVPGRFVHEPVEDAVYLEYSCPCCGNYRQRHHDALVARGADRLRPGQPERTRGGDPIRPITGRLPRTVETLCPECGCILLGRYYDKSGAVYMEKTCPEHGYFRDRINSDLRLYRKAARMMFQDERGVLAPQVTGASHCPTDCGLCNQHMSASCLAQIDLTNRCNLSCAVCFANADASGYVAEPSFEMVAEMLRALREQHPYPATAIQFTGGEPTLHPRFHDILRLARDMGFSQIQLATNGLTCADRDFVERSADAGLHTLYLQFDGVTDEFYRKVRGRPLFEKKLRCIENCGQAGLKAVLVPTIIRGVNDDQVGEIFRFAVRNIHAVSGISYQPVAFTGRIDYRDLERRRYTLGDLAHDLALASGADLDRDFLPLGAVAPLGRIMECLDGKPKIRPSCHSDCAFGTYFFVTPEHRAIPMCKLFDMYQVMRKLNDQARRIQARRHRPDEIVRGNAWDVARVVWTFLRHYDWSQFFSTDIRPWTFIRALQGLTDKRKGRGTGERGSYKTLMAAGMHFMDRYNFDVERARRCVIQYSTPDGVYPFCTLNGGPAYRPFIERMLARTPAEYRRELSAGTGQSDRPGRPPAAGQPVSTPVVEDPAHDQ